MYTSEELDEAEKEMNDEYFVPEAIEKEVINRRLRREIAHSRSEIRKMLSGDIQFHNDEFKQVKD